MDLLNPREPINIQPPGRARPLAGSFPGARALPLVRGGRKHVPFLLHAYSSGSVRARFAILAAARGQPTLTFHVHRPAGAGPGWWLMLARRSSARYVQRGSNSARTQALNRLAHAVSSQLSSSISQGVTLSARIFRNRLASTGSFSGRNRGVVRSPVRVGTKSNRDLPRKGDHHDPPEVHHDLCPADRAVHQGRDPVRSLRPALPGKSNVLPDRSCPDPESGSRLCLLSVRRPFHLIAGLSFRKL